jgi:hypothetical protein
MTEHKSLANYILDIVDITDFRSYLDKNELYFSTNAKNAYLKAVDIPPKFFREQPIETQKELLDNREVFVRENKKYFNKVIVVVTIEKDNGVSVDRRILGAARLSAEEANTRYEQLSTISQIPNKFEHRSFIKDGYISLIISEDIKKGVDNQVLAVDFPINLNKKPIIHKALYTLPDDTFATPIEHVKYLTETEVELGIDYNNIKEAIDEEIDFLTDTTRVEAEPQQILRETEMVALALRELGTIPKAYKEKIEVYIEENLKGAPLTTDRLESLVLDFDETFKSYKQVTNLRSVSGFGVLRFLESSQFEELAEELADVELLPV